MPAPSSTTTDLVAAARKAGVPISHNLDQSRERFEIVCGVVQSAAQNTIRQKADELANLIEFAGYGVPFTQEAEIMSEDAAAAATNSLIALARQLDDLGMTS